MQLQGLRCGSRAQGAQNPSQLTSPPDLHSSGLLLLLQHFLGQLLNVALGNDRG